MKLVRHLKGKGIPIAVATSSHRKAFELKSSQNGELFDLFDEIVCGDDMEIKKGKPAPDLFLTAAKKLGHDLEDCSNCLVFEDAPSGVTAGLNANMAVCWVHDIKMSVDEHLKSNVHECIHSMELFGATHSFLDHHPDVIQIPSSLACLDSINFRLYLI
jgi:beta-phosphoglucomutase-like phosphatase (HAD superfamily)